LIENYAMMDGAKRESQKFAFVSRVFLYKTMEAIYQARCSDQVKDFEKEPECWFQTNLPRSASLRQQVTSEAVHGWFSIDISISDSSAVVERWYLIHLPLKAGDSLPSPTSNIQRLKLDTFRQFSQLFRSIYSLMHCLPAAALCYVLQQFSAVKRHLVGTTSPFQKFPARLESYCDSETANVKFGPVVTPVGKIVVICQHRVDILPLIPTPVRTAPHYSFRRQIPLTPSDVDTYGQSLSTSSNFRLSPLPEVNLGSFVPHPFPDGFEDMDVDEPIPVEDFISTIASLHISDFGAAPTPAIVVGRYRSVVSELDQLVHTRR
jgi:hypothetical protein